MAVQSSLHETQAREVENVSEPLFAVAHVLLQQVIDLLGTTVTKDDQLSFPSALIPGSTIGKHLRHINDHFRLLLDSLSSTPSYAPLQLSYDARSRNVASECSHALALASFVGLQRRLEVETGEGKKIPANRKVHLEAVTPVVVDMESTFARELWFTCLHATHHFALLRVVAVGELHLSIPPEFGVAPSTLVSRLWEAPALAAAVVESPKL